MKKWVQTKSRILSIRVTDDANSKLEMRAKKLKRSVSDTVRMAVEKFLAEK